MLKLEQPNPLHCNSVGSYSSRDVMTWWKSVPPTSLELPHNSQCNLLFIFLLPCCFQPPNPRTVSTAAAERTAEWAEREDERGDNKKRRMHGGRGELTWKHLNRRGRATGNNDQQGSWRKRSTKWRESGFMHHATIYMKSQQRNRIQDCS